MQGVIRGVLRGVGNHRGSWGESCLRSEMIRVFVGRWKKFECFLRWSDSCLGFN